MDTTIPAAFRSFITTEKLGGTTICKPTEPLREVFRHSSHPDAEILTDMMIKSQDWVDLEKMSFQTQGDPLTSLQEAAFTGLGMMGGAKGGRLLDEADRALIKRAKMPVEVLLCGETFLVMQRRWDWLTKALDHLPLAGGCSDSAVTLSGHISALGSARALEECEYKSWSSLSRQLKERLKPHMSSFQPLLEPDNEVDLCLLLGQTTLLPDGWKSVLCDKVCAPNRNYPKVFKNLHQQEKWRQAPSFEETIDAWLKKRFRIGKGVLPCSAIIVTSAFVCDRYAWIAQQKLPPESLVFAIGPDHAKPPNQGQVYKEVGHMLFEIHHWASVNIH